MAFLETNRPTPINTDVVVVGAGGAGARAAIAARDAGVRVLVLSKSNIGRAHTVDAEGGINSALGNADKRDSWRVHAKDTLREGYFLGDKKAVHILTKEAPARVRELARFGMPFDRRPDGKIDQRWMAAHTYRRTSYASDKTGFFLLQTLIKQAQKRKIAFRSGVVVARLLADESGARGLVALDFNSGRPLVVKCRAIILSTGGYTRIYKKTSHEAEAYGDGAALAYRAGCALMDMEMVQFHPTGMVAPRAAQGILVTEAMRGMGAKLFNAKGERFMKKYDARRLELAPRDVVARAIWTEIKAGRGTKNNAVWEDITGVKASLVKSKLSKMYQQFKFFAHLDITKKAFEVAPTAHYCMGGVKVNPQTGATCVPGVFTAGEVDAGVHGANRLGGNSLADILVFGRRAGRSAANLALKEGVRKNKSVAARRDRINTRSLKEALDFLAEPKDPLESLGRVDKESRRARLGRSVTTRSIIEDPTKLKDHLRKIVSQHAGLAKNGPEIVRGLKLLDNLAKKLIQVRIRGSLKQNQKWLDLLETSNMLICARANMRAALMRQESRGAHFRLDFPKQSDKKWLANIVINKKGEQMFLSRVPIKK